MDQTESCNSSVDGKSVGWCGWWCGGKTCLVGVVLEGRSNGSVLDALNAPFVGGVTDVERARIASVSKGKGIMLCKSPRNKTGDKFESPGCTIVGASEVGKVRRASEQTDRNNVVLETLNKQDRC